MYFSIGLVRKTDLCCTAQKNTFETAKVSRLAMLQCMWSGFLPLLPKYPPHTFSQRTQTVPLLTGVPADSFFQYFIHFLQVGVRNINS